MLGLVVAPLSGIEFVASPKLTGRVHRRTELSSTLRAPWDVNLENILDNVRLALATKVQTGVVRHDVLVNYDRNANRWNFLDASIKADVLRAADVRLGYELKRTFVDKLTSLRLRLSSPEVAGCSLVAEVDPLKQSLSTVTPSVGLDLGERCKLLGKTQWHVAAKAMKHVGRLQVLTRTLRDVNGNEVNAVPLELRATVTQKLGDEESDLDYEIAVEQELGFLKGVGATFNSKAELTLTRTTPTLALTLTLTLTLTLALTLALALALTRTARAAPATWVR